MNKQNKAVKVRLTKQAVLLAVFGARQVQENPIIDLSQSAKYALSQCGALCSYEGAKMYQLGGGWWQISGYCGRVTSKLQLRFPNLRSDERDTLRTIGFAV